MKKTGIMLLIVLMMVPMLFSQGKSEAKEVATVSAIDEPADHDELVRLAQEEGSLVVYAITSRFGSVAKSFEEKYGIKVEASNVKDKEIYTKVTTEIGGGTYGADLVVAHDTYRVQTLLLNTGFCFTQTPNSLKAKIPAKYQDPLIWQLTNKMFMYNTEFGEKAPFDNFWAVTDPKYKDSVYLKDPNTEAPNFNFMAMLTTPENSAKLEKAYKAYYGKDIEKKKGETAGHVWMRMFLKNSVGNDSETNIAKDVATKGQKKQWVGWTAYSKFRMLKEDDNYAIGAITDVDPFGVYLTPYYLLIAKNAKNPHAALLFIEYLFTDAGFAPWANELGSYPVTDDLYILDPNKLPWWEERGITDDPDFLAENRFGIEEYFNNLYYN